MSFADLRSARKSKETKSFVSSGGTGQHRVDATTESTNRAENIDTDVKPKDSAVSNIPPSLPTSLDTRASPIAGRGLFAKITFSPGAVIFYARPRVIALSTSALSSCCSHCSGPPLESALKRCTRCRTVWYCDAACQNKDWQSHKLECDALQRWAAAAPSVEVSVPSDAIRCLGRVLWARQKRGPESEFVKEWNNLQSHRVSLQPSTFESHTHLAHSLVRYIGATSPEDLAPFGLSSAGELVDLISRFTTNTFTLTSSSLEPIGVCVAPSFALSNHSCEPNAVLVFPRASAIKTQEPQMHLIAIRPIAPDEEVLISYVDTTLPRQSRQLTLKETYNFLCSCSSCTAPAHLDPRQSIWCPKSCGGTCPVPSEESDLVHCSSCNAIIPSSASLLDALRIGQDALDKASSLRSKDPARSLHITTHMLPILTSARLTPSCHPLLALTRLHQELLMASFTPDLSQDLLDRTVEAAANYSAGVTNILVYAHPIRAAALAELGKLLAVDEIAPREPPTAFRYPPSGPRRLRMAYETLIKAHEELTIGFGTVNQGGSMGNEVREILVRLEKELGVWTQGIRDALRDQRLAAVAQ